MMSVRAARVFPLAFLLAAALPQCRSVVEEPTPVPSDQPHCGPYAHRTTTLKAQGGRVDWSRTNGLIAYDRPGDDGYYDVYTMAADGSRETCLTCGKGALGPQKNNGNPAWHPSGNYIVFQSEVADSQATPFASYPGRGINNVLWVTDPAGQQFTQLTASTSRTPRAVSSIPTSRPTAAASPGASCYESAARSRACSRGCVEARRRRLRGRGRPAHAAEHPQFEPGGPAFTREPRLSPDGTHSSSAATAQPGLSSRSTTTSS
jgi:hypothetical protein